jgi:hypothetical protein
LVVGDGKEAREGQDTTSNAHAEGGGADLVLFLYCQYVDPWTNCGDRYLPAAWMRPTGMQACPSDDELATSDATESVVTVASLPSPVMVQPTTGFAHKNEDANEESARAPGTRI